MDDSGVNGLRCPEPNRAVSLCFALYACVLVNLFFFFNRKVTNSYKEKFHLDVW